nr:hypothetical protein [Tanacetum cinerariifolium]
MCEAYSCEPSVDLFLGFFNLCRASKWLRSEKHVSNILPKVITRIEGWHEQFFYVQDSIISTKYLQLLSEQNKLDSKSFKDKIPPNIKENPIPSWEYGQQQPAIMIGDKEMAFRNFIYTEDDEDLSFLPKEPSSGFDTSSTSVSVNTEPLKAIEEFMIQPAEVTIDSREISKHELFVVHPGSVAARIKDRKCKTREGSSRPSVKRKLASGSSTSRVDKTTFLKDDVPYLTVSNDDEGFLDVIEKLRGEFDVIKDRERARKEECEELRAKCEATIIEFEKNPTVVALQEKTSTLFTEVTENKASLNIMILESQKWAGYQQSLLNLESKVTSLEAEKARLEAIELDEFVADLSAPIEALLSKKPSSVQRPALQGLKSLCLLLRELLHPQF